MPAMSPRASNLLYLITGAVAVAAVVAVLGLGSDHATKPAVAQTTPSPSTGTPASVADIYRRVSPGVVFIAAGSGSGSGFVIDSDGSIVTNDHVVGDSQTVSVRFGEQSDPVDAKVVGTDPSTDLALVKVDPSDVKGGLKPLPLATSKNLEPGEPAIAIGSPFGLQGTVTSGIVSALGREIQSPNGFPISGVVQTDAAINPGNSGGPLLDGDGRVIGVNSQIATNGANANSGVGFAVPIDTVKQVIPQLERDGQIDRSYLGVSTSEAPPRDGALVREVTPGSPAEQAGLQPGDLVVQFDGEAIRSPSDLGQTVLTRKPGDTVDVVVQRNGSRETVQVKLGDRPDQAPQG
jgi:putative serine protease PepD